MSEEDKIAETTSNTDENEEDLPFFEALKINLAKIQPIELVVALILFILGIYFSYDRFHEEGDNKIYYMYFMILVGFILGSYLWIRATNRFFGRFIYYLVEHKYTRKIIAGGSFSYYGYIDPEEISTKNYVLGPFKQLISLTIAFVGIASIIVGLLFPDDADNPILWGVLTIVVPILATPLVPVLWSLQDANVKAFAKGNKTTWVVSQRYRNRYNSIITIGAVYANLQDTDAGDLVDRIKVFLDVLLVGFLVMLISVSLFIIVYYGWFKHTLNAKIKDSLELKTFDVVLDEYIDDFDDEEGDEEEISDMDKTAVKAVDEPQVVATDEPETRMEPGFFDRIKLKLIEVRDSIKASIERAKERFKQWREKRAAQKTVEDEDEEEYEEEYEDEYEEESSEEDVDEVISEDTERTEEEKDEELEEISEDQESESDEHEEDVDEDQEEIQSSESQEKKEDEEPKE